MRERLVIDQVEWSGDVGPDGKPLLVVLSVIYDGIGRLRSYRPYEQNLEVGAATVIQQRTDWHIPAIERLPDLVSAGVVSLWNGPVQAGHRIRRLTPGKPVKVAWIGGEHDVTDQTAQRFVVDEITGGPWSQEAP